MSKNVEPRAAVEIVAPSDAVREKYAAVSALARACEALAEALRTPVVTYTFSGNISNTTTGVPGYGVRSRVEK